MILDGDVKYLNPDSKITTPQVDRLALQGIVFTDTHTSFSVCTPSRCSIITGKYNWLQIYKKEFYGV